MSAEWKPAACMICSMNCGIQVQTEGMFGCGMHHDFEHAEVALLIGTVIGPEGIRAVLEPFFALTIRNEFLILRAAEAGSVVFCERIDRHQIADKWVEIPVTGVFEVRNGLITYWRDYFDAATILSQWPER